MAKVVFQIIFQGQESVTNFHSANTLDACECIFCVVSAQLCPWRQRTSASVVHQVYVHLSWTIERLPCRLAVADSWNPPLLTSSFWYHHLLNSRCVQNELNCCSSLTFVSQCWIETACIGIDSIFQGGACGYFLSGVRGGTKAHKYNNRNFFPIPTDAFRWYFYEENRIPSWSLHKIYRFLRSQNNYFFRYFWMHLFLLNIQSLQISRKLKAPLKTCTEEAGCTLSMLGVLNTGCAHCVGPGSTWHHSPLPTI